MSKIKIPESVTGYGYVGAWKSPKSKLGWFVAPFIYGKQDRQNPAITDNPNAKGERFFLCEITIKPVLDKKKRPITKLT